ncbi:Ypk2p [Saccharomyces cerevisiae x Saccharomyces kudriavzevii VIN7]|uniref:non-specific serine/threonine protein kinase n=1 Tax=Saccharomyces cerevisiae x Saccharomyces kudriavzevii (strain VIN7) TaxID=1095631 RepID=H0GZB9_SACCK|nr:Ypk2p [Saccharomyces cerevisiae x Saccharomyces kudriavzevii VIN7]
MHSWRIPKFKLGKSKEESGNNEDDNEKSWGNSLFHLHLGEKHHNGNPKSHDHEHEHHIRKINTNETLPSSLSSPKLRNDTSSKNSLGPESANPGDFESNASQSSTETKAPGSESGLMTVKIYSGENFSLPFPITSNATILEKLLSSGILNSSPNDASEVATIMQELPRYKIADQGSAGEGLIDKTYATKFVPSTILLPGSANPSPLLYFTIEFDNSITTIGPDMGTMEQPVFNKISTFDVTRKLRFLKIDVFVRIPSLLLPSKNWQQEIGEQDDTLRDIFKKINTNQDVHLDSFHLPLNLEIDSAAQIRLYNHHWILSERGYGKLNITVDYTPSKNKPLSIDDFDLLKVIGRGSFGKVMQVRKRDTQKIYALKALRKAYIVSKCEVTHTLAERTVLARVDCPFIVPLKFSFQSPEKLYLVLAFINGGELFYHLQHEGQFSLARSRFYISELLCALDSLHRLDVIYRDLKPENILLDYQGHIALCDFGLCKLNMKDNDKTDTFCGTPEYLAPEILLGQGYTKTVDWWTLGILLYEMMTGLPPYYDENVPVMYKKILQQPLLFPDGFDLAAKDLLIGLLSRDPNRRLGVNGTDEIRNHFFFKDISWKKLLLKGYIPPYKPPVKSEIDTANFDQEFTREKPIDSVVDEYLSASIQKQFGGWTYIGDEQLGDSISQGKSLR